MSNQETLTTQQVADKFYQLMEEGKFDVIQNELFDRNVKSIEPEDSGWDTVQGIDAVKQKGVKWQSMVEEMHGGYTNPPIVAGDYFSCAMGMDVTMKGQGRTKIDEIAVYHVKNGKILSEQFFF